MPIGQLIVVLVCAATGTVLGAGVALARRAPRVHGLIVGALLLMVSFAIAFMVPGLLWYWLPGLTVLLPAAYGGRMKLPARLHNSRCPIIRLLILNGSFVTDAYEPNDVDCALLLGPDASRDPLAEAELVAGLPFLQIDFVEQKDFDIMIGVVFASDRAAVPKGMIEVKLWD